MRKTPRAFMIDHVHIPADIPANHKAGNAANDRHDRIPVTSAEQRPDARTRNCANKFANILITGIRRASRNTNDKSEYRG
jgi:hypothetical protein